MRFPPGCQVSRPRELPAPAAKTASKRFFHGAGGPTSVELRSQHPLADRTTNALASKHSRPQTPRWHRIFLPATEWCQNAFIHPKWVMGNLAPHRNFALTIYGEMTSQKHQVKRPDDGWVNMTTLPFLPTIGIDST